MRYAIFSDVHNNTAALNVMLRDTAARNIDAYLCLGDLGSDSCVELARNVGAEAVFGNWEVSGWRYLSPANQRWALNLPPMRKYDDFWISHAAPNWSQKITSLRHFLKVRYQTGFGVLFPYYLNVSDGLWQAFSELLSVQIPLLFHGHTHRQIVWALTPDNELGKQHSVDFDLRAEYTYIIGVGSVGQPRDFPKPAYVIFDAEARRVEFVRF